MPTVMEGAERARVSKRFSFFEEPRVLEKLEEVAAQSGRSASSEVRSAVRYWLAAFEDDDDE